MKHHHDIPSVLDCCLTQIVPSKPNFGIIFDYYAKISEAAACEARTGQRRRRCLRRTLGLDEPALGSPASLDFGWRPDNFDDIYLLYIGFCVVKALGVAVPARGIQGGHRRSQQRRQDDDPLQIVRSL